MGVLGAKKMLVWGGGVKIVIGQKLFLFQKLSEMAKN